MRTLNKNKQEMYYSLLIGEKEIYVFDNDGNRILDYTDDDGIVYYRTEKRAMYSKPVKFYGNIAMSGGEARMVEYGLNQEQYEAVLITPLGELPITETSKIWFKSVPKTNFVEYWFVGDNGKTLMEIPDEFSADYNVVSVKSSINVSKYVLSKIVK